MLCNVHLKRVHNNFLCGTNSFSHFLLIATGHFCHFMQNGARPNEKLDT